MRQVKPPVGRTDPSSAAGSGWGAGSEVFGQIVDGPEQSGPPSLDRLGPVWVGRHRATGRERLRASLQADGRVVDDLLDGSRVYGRPPHHTRPVHLTERLQARLDVWLLPFVLVAAAQELVTLADASAKNGWNGESLLRLVCQLGYTACLALIPAGILVWRRDAWRSARLLLVGAIVWTTIPALVSVAWWVVRLFPNMAGELSRSWSVVVAAVTVVASAGPAIVALGLERERTNRAGWLVPTIREVGLVGSPLLFVNGLTWLPPSGAGIDPAQTAWTFGGFVLPLTLLFSLMLAASCLSAVVGEEPQRRIWQWVAAGAVLMAVLSIDEMASGVLPLALGTRAAASAAVGWSGAWVDAMLLAAAGCLLLAFTSPIWSSAKDAFLSGRAAPDSVFAWGPDARAIAAEPLAMTTIVALAAGRDHALALDDHGHVGAWGDDSAGQTDVPPGLSEAIDVAAGDGFSLVLQADGSVVAWGANKLGQTSVPTNLGPVKAIAAGADFGLALRADGSVVGWGDPESPAMVVPDGLAGVSAISAGDCHALALRRDGSVAAWGDDTYGQSTVPPRLGRVVAVSAGGAFSLALLDDGTVTAWGDGGYGQLDVPAGLSRVTAISAGVFHALALRADGDVVGWGGGQRRGEAERPWRLVDFKAIAAGDGFSLAVRAADTRLGLKID